MKKRPKTTCPNRTLTVAERKLVLDILGLKRRAQKLQLLMTMSELDRAANLVGFEIISTFKKRFYAMKREIDRRR